MKVKEGKMSMYSIPKNLKVDPSKKRVQYEKMIINTQSPFDLIEAYNEIRTNLLYLPIDHKCKVLAFTSSISNEGKTVTTINVAKSMAQIGKKVLFIDADMRASLANYYLNVSDTNGLSEYLVGIDAKPNIQIFKEHGEFFSVLLKGKKPPNPSELLLSDRFEKLIEEWKREYEYIFIDTPPLEMVADATALLSHVHGYFIVVKAEYSDVEQVKRTVEKLSNLNANIYGFVLNDIDYSKKYYSKYNHYYNTPYANSNVSSHGDFSAMNWRLKGKAWYLRIKEMLFRNPKDE